MKKYSCFFDSLVDVSTHNLGNKLHKIKPELTISECVFEFYKQNPNFNVFETHEDISDSKPIFEHFLKTDQIETYDFHGNFHSDKENQMFGNLLKTSKNLKILKFYLYYYLSEFEIIFEGLSENKSIEKLEFFFTGLSSEDLKIVGKFFKNTKTLKSIKLEIPEKYLQVILSNLLENKNLKLNDIIFEKDCSFGDFSCQLFSNFLKTTKTLKWFSIKTLYQLESLDDVLQGIIENESLEYFFISSLDDFETDKMKQIIKSKRNLIKKSGQIMGKDVNKFLKSLKLIPNLVEIDVQRSRINKQDLEIFKEMLKLIFESVEEFNIDGCHLNVEKFKYLGKNLNQIKKLKTLILDNNDISEEVAEILFESLGTNTTIETIYMYFCSLEKGNILEILGNAMKKNKTLKTLHIGSNIFSREIGIKFFDLLKENKTLENLHISTNDYLQQLILLEIQKV